MTRDAMRSDEAAAPGAGSEPARVITSQAGAKAAGENFPVALRMLPARYRRHLTAVYVFARSADDMGDEAPPAQRLALLDELEADLGRLYQHSAGPGPTAPPKAGPGPTAPPKAGPGPTAPPNGGRDGPRLPVIRALAPTVMQCAIPAQPFLDLIQANRQDQVVTRYQTFDELLAYCRLSANPVGRIVLHVFGAATPHRERLSDLVCTALQLAEHWQDVAEDLRAGRVYLPGKDLAAYGVTEADLAAPSASPQVRALIGFEVRRAADLLDEGARITGTLRGFARAAVAGYVAGGRAALAAITASGCDVLAATPRPRNRRVAAELLRAYLTGR